MLNIKLIVGAVVVLLGISGVALASGHGPGFLDDGSKSISGSGQNELSDTGAAVYDQYASDSDEDDMDDAAGDQYADDDDADENEIDDDANDDDADEIDDADENEIDDDANDSEGHRAGPPAVIPPAPQAGGSQSRHHDSDDHERSYEHSNQGSQQGAVTGANNAGSNSGSSRSRDHAEEDD